MNLEDCITDDSKVNRDEIQLVLPLLKVDQSIPDSATFSLHVLYSVDNQQYDNGLSYKRIYTTDLKCNIPKYDFKYKAPLFDLGIGKSVHINKVSILSTKGLRDDHLVLTDAIEYWPLDDKEGHTLTYRNESFHFGINMCNIIEPKQLLTLTCKQIIARLKKYVNIKAFSNTEGSTTFNFEEETHTIPLLLKGHYYDTHSPMIINVEEYPYELKKFSINIYDDDVETKMRNVVADLIKLFDSINSAFISS